MFFETTTGLLVWGRSALYACPILSYGLLKNTTQGLIFNKVTIIFGLSRTFVSKLDFFFSFLACGGEKYNEYQ